MIFSYNWLQSFFSKKLPRPKEVAEVLTMHSFEVGKVKKVDRDYILDIEVLPNRAGDCFSHIGIARECAALIISNFQFPISKLKEDKNLKAKDFISVEVKNKMACPRYTARVISDVKVGPSPKWLEQRLKVCGLRPINNIVDIANYIMLETGQPLHAFDFEKIESVNPKSEIRNPKKIIVRFAKREEKIITLDGEKYDLDEDILIIADSKYPLAIAGIKGGLIAEIDKKTKTIVLESANFNFQVIRKSSKKLNLKTDASIRFEHGIDPNLTEFALNRAANLIQKIAKGKITQGIIDVYPKKILSKRIRLELDYVKSLLGIEIPRIIVMSILKRLGLEIKKSTKNFLDVLIPSRRLDISIQEDLIEEIGRIYGYEKISSIFPFSSLVPVKRNLDIFWENMVKDILKQVGFTEVYNYSFIGENMAEIFKEKNLIEIENPVSIEQKYLRPSLIFNLLKNIKTNQKEFKEIKIFELGKIFKIANKGLKITDYKEKKMLAGAIMGKQSKEGFYEVKGIIDLLLNKLGISNIWYDEYHPSPEHSGLRIWHPKKCAEIKVDHQKIGFLGEIHSQILEELEISNRIVFFDIDFEQLEKISSEEYEYKPISRYPAAIRDLAILVPRMTKVVDVLNEINIQGGALVRDVDLFDIYEGEELLEGKKSLAFHIIYQAEDRTLSSKEIDEVHNKIIKLLEKKVEWEVRK